LTDRKSSLPFDSGIAENHSLVKQANLNPALFTRRTTPATTQIKVVTDTKLMPFRSLRLIIADRNQNAMNIRVRQYEFGNNCQRPASISPGGLKQNLKITFTGNAG